MPSSSPPSKISPAPGLPRSSEGLYPTSVVTESTGVGAHTLRGYERAGLLRPARSEGGMRRYSHDNLTVIRRAAELAGEGVNLAGIRQILRLETELARLHAQICTDGAESSRT